MVLGAPELILIVTCFLCLILLWVVPYWFIFRKAGYPPALSLLMMIPLVNIAMVFYLALADWPILKQLRKEDAQ